MEVTDVSGQPLEALLLLHVILARSLTLYECFSFANKLIHFFCLLDHELSSRSMISLFEQGSGLDFSFT